MLPGADTAVQTEGLAISIDTGFIWLPVALLLLGFIVYTSILIYHWFKYATHTPMMLPVMGVYFVGSFILFSLIFFSALSIAT